MLVFVGSEARWLCLLSVLCSACSSLLDLEEYRRAAGEQAERPVSVAVRDEDCDSVIGPLEDPRAIRLGSLFATSGAQAETNRNRERSARLAIEELNAAGGVPEPGSSQRRPLALVTCNAAGDLLRAGRHLIEDLGVHAIIGPNGSQDTIDLAMNWAIASNTLTISPTAVAASIAELRDDDLSWTMVPSDSARAPLLLQQISRLESRLRASRGPLKLSVILRDDVLGAGLRAELSRLTFDDLPLSDPRNLGQRVHIVDYDPKALGQPLLVQDELGFAPDIIVMVGTAETVTDIMAPLEARWTAANRPYYLLTESSKVPDLLRLARERPGLAARVRGVGVVPVAASQPLFDQFVRSYERRYGAVATDTSGMAASYDSAYALAYAIAAAPAPLGGTHIAAGLRRLTGGRTPIRTGPGNLEEAFAALASGGSVDAIGSLTPLAWNEGGVVDEGQIEVWCLAPEGSGYRSSGLRFDLSARVTLGEATFCDEVSESATPTRASLPAEPAPQAPQPMPSSAPQEPPQSAVPASAGEAVPAVPSNVPVDIGIAAQYLANNRDPVDNVISPFVRLVNRSEREVPLATLSVRYYFSNEHSAACPEQCVIEGFYAGVQPTGQAVRARRAYVQGESSSYLELSFDPRERALRPGESVELQQQFHTEPYRDMDETNDYSFSRWALQYRDWRQITVYQGSQLVWGTPPTGSD